MDNSTLSIWITFLDKIYYTETKRARLHEPICELGNAFDIRSLDLSLITKESKQSVTSLSLNPSFDLGRA